MGESKKRKVMAVWGLMAIGLTSTLAFAIEKAVDEISCTSQSGKPAKAVTPSGGTTEKDESGSVSGTVGGSEKNPAPAPKHT